MQDLERVVDHLAHRKRPARHALAYRFALEQLRNHEGGPIVRAHVEDRQDVGVVEDPGGPGLQLKPVDAFGVLRELGREGFESHFAAEARIERAIDLSHPASA